MGTIARPNSPLTASDGYSEVDANEVVIAAAINGNLNHENLASEGVRNANIDKDEVFAKETWDNILSDGHFPVWSSGTSSVPDSWTAELTATIARDDAPTYAPSAHYSCKITGAGAALEGIYQTIELRKNATYTVNLKVKATAGDTAVIKVVDGDDAEKASQEYTDADWQTDDNKKYFTFTTGTTTNAGEIKIKLLAKVDTDIVWFGEVQVTEGTMAKGFQYISSDADTVDTIHASATPAANKLMALNADARFPQAAVAIFPFECSGGMVGTTWTDLDTGTYDTVTFTISATSTIVLLGIYGLANNAAADADMQILYDSTQLGTMSAGNGVYPIPELRAMRIVKADVAAGTYTIKAQIKTQGGVNANGIVSGFIMILP